MNRTNKNFLRAGMLILSAVAAMPLRAAIDSGYQIEIIIFERDARSAAATHEQSDRHTAPPDYSNAVMPGNNNIGLLTPGRFQLTGMEQKLKRSGRTPLVHTGWIQRRSESRAARITSGETAAGDTAPNVDGAVRLKVGELLSVGVDLTCRDNNGEVTSIIETRTVKFGELHYFDGDQFGVLMQVIRATGGE
jgi:hypothetical protein